MNTNCKLASCVEIVKLLLLTTVPVLLVVYYSQYLLELDTT